MKHKVLVVGNGVVALAFVAISVAGILSARISSDEADARGFLLVAGWFGLAAFGYARANRVICVLTSVVAILGSGFFMFLLLFAPLAWGDSNLPTIYALQGSLLAIAILEIVGLAALFRKPA